MGSRGSVGAWDGKDREILGVLSAQVCSEDLGGQGLVSWEVLNPDS